MINCQLLIVNWMSHDISLNVLIVSVSLLKTSLIFFFSLKKQRACCSYLWSITLHFLTLLPLTLLPLLDLVENIGLEPMTPCVQGRCSKPTELIPRYLVHNWHLIVDNYNLSFDSGSRIDSLTVNCQLSIVNFFCSPRQSWTADLYIISVAL